MKKLLTCRRSMIAILAIFCLTAVALVNGTDTSMAIASVAMGVAGANALQRRVE